MSNLLQNLKGLLPSVSGAASKELTLDEFCVVWGKLCAAYPKNETSSLTVEVYFERLSGYEKEPVLEAIGNCLDECKWFPTVSEIVERIKSPRGCIHRLALAEIRSKQAMLDESEKYADRRLHKIAQEVAELENKSVELYERDREMIEKSGLADARNKLADLNGRILEAERTLTLLRAKIKLLDQARILQADDVPN